jgi:hypothetical protein
MRPLLKFVVCLCILQLLVGAPPLHAQWEENGTGVCRAVNYQTGCRIAPDGAGGAFIVWKDFRNSSDYKVYAQRIDARGNTLWAMDGILVCSAVYSQTEPEIAADGAGGAIIGWEDYRSASSYDIYVQRLDADGNELWTADGVAVCTAGYNQDSHGIISDGAGGAIVTWRDIRNGSDYDIYAQRVDAGGAVLWTADGVGICTASGNQQYPVLISDGAGGAVITWQDGRVAQSDIYAQRINAAGAVQWTADGVAVCAASDFQYYPEIVPASSGGAIIAWTDYRGADGDVYANKIDASGVVQWGANGTSVCAISEDQSTPRLVPVGTGGAIIAWSDRRSTTYFDIYAQRLDANGFHQWTDNGIAICTASNHQHLLSAVSAGDDRVNFIWKDYRSTTSYDLYIQKVDLYGEIQWATDGVAVSTANNDQVAACAIAYGDDGDGSTIVAWDDERIGPFYDIFAQRIDADGSWGYPNPRITSVRDVPQDQGGFVNIAWDASQYDPIGQITEYSIWRALDIAQAAMMMEGPAHLLASAADIPETPAGPVLRMELLGGLQFYWELIDVHTAYHIDHYSKIVSTAFDSTATANEYHYFQIIAHTANPMTFYASQPDSGYSVDNLSPCPPLALAGEQSYVPEGLTLTWDPNTETDLDGYAIYRGVGPGFTPGPGNLLAEPCDTFYFDDGWRWDGGYCYKVAALDVHGNESGYALLCSEDVTGGETPEVPQASFLAQNHPNPFNPATTISFGLHEPAHATLKIYDAAGRLVRVIIDGHRAANRYEVTWNGRDAAGNAAASGVYFYKLEAGSFRETKKMVLLK